VTAARSVGGRLALVGPAVLAGLGFVAAWQLLVWVGDYPPFILPGPLQVGQRFVEAWLDGTLVRHTLVSLWEIVLGFAAGSLVGLVVGGLLARSRLASRLLSPYLVAAQSVPILAIAPLLTLWFGSGLLPKVLICALIAFFPVAISTMVGLRTVDPRLIELGRSLRADRRQQLLVIELPAALPTILGGLRVAITLAVVGAIVAEWAGAEAGLGWLLNLARGGSFDTPLLFATLVTIALLGIALYGLMVGIERLMLGDRG
jgi:NitT/TauT family transport system permease protein